MDVKDTELADIFEKFRERCIRLRIFYNTYCHRFEAGEEVSDILRRTAVLFFHDLNGILIEQIYLHIGRITDPARNGKHENLSVENLNEMLRGADLMTNEIDLLSKKLSHYRSLINETRNKAIAHLDKDTAVNDRQIGEHAPHEVTDFFENLQKYCDEVGWVTGMGPLDFRTVPGAGDALDLINALRRSLKSQHH